MAASFSFLTVSEFILNKLKFASANTSKICLDKKYTPLLIYALAL